MSIKKCPVFQKNYSNTSSGKVLSPAELKYLEGFYRVFQDESDVELERKRDVARNWISTVQSQGLDALINDPVKHDTRLATQGFDKDLLPREKFDILTYLIQLRSRQTGFGAFVRRYQLVGFVSGLIIVLVPMLWQKYDRQKSVETARMELANAFAGEISAIVDTGAQTIGIKYLAGLLTELKNGKEWKPVDRPPERSTPVFESSAHKLGGLEGCASKRIARFYSVLSRQREKRSHSWAMEGICHWRQVAKFTT